MREEFVQEIQPPIRLIIFGDYFDAEAVAHSGRLLGWQVEVVTDAPRTSGRGCAHGVRGDVASFRPRYRGSETGVRGQFGYVGLLGPRQRKQLLLNRLIDEGYPPENVSALHSPAGLDIGSETAEEIAMAIIAEVQAALTGRNGGSLRDRVEPIHTLEEPIFCDELR